MRHIYHIRTVNCDKCDVGFSSAYCANDCTEVEFLKWTRDEGWWMGAKAQYCPACKPNRGISGEKP